MLDQTRRSTKRSDELVWSGERNLRRELPFFIIPLTELQGSQNEPVTCRKAFFSVSHPSSLIHSSLLTSETHDSSGTPRPLSSAAQTPDSSLGLQPPTHTRAALALSEWPTLLTGRNDRFQHGAARRGRRLQFQHHQCPARQALAPEEGCGHQVQGRPPAQVAGRLLRAGVHALWGDKQLAFTKGCKVTKERLTD